ncbi:hypothetical protein BD324DRAFT_160484 [Kockovaella imperatae]|uniref:C2H2-type domain-containing protein n=1 Tax=Kockovaella imperatae TaxID=4999 RepID=A0A1Y1UBV2_9TREE|nr:hypothetical protein BD324DRAFT_160484 [Kockovaella imperatae]ORX34565.1 hypothetical protein BD324DRAFT_160484 [Kockovaella imperatae]
MEADRSAIKRSRSASSSSSISDISSRSLSFSPPPKYHRGSTSNSTKFTCSLEPTCSGPGRSSSYATSEELSRHHDAFHKWVCRTLVRDKADEPATPTNGPSKKMTECCKAFPEERLLSLHQAETHDPIIQERQNRGDKIFECFLPKGQCQKTFLTPAKRRRHLIDKHHYPKDYFFSITNHGVSLCDCAHVDDVRSIAWSRKMV